MVSSDMREDVSSQEKRVKAPDFSAVVARALEYRLNGIRLTLGPSRRTMAHAIVQNKTIQRDVGAREEL